MARIHHVKKSAKEHTCSHAPTHIIEKGEPYYWAKPGFRRRHPITRCKDHPFRESDLITGQRADIVRAKEDALDAIERAGSPEEVESAMADFGASADDYQSIRQEALDAWPNGNSALEEFVYQAEAIVSEVDGWAADEFEEPDEADVDLEAEGYESFQEYLDDKREEHLEEWKDAARDLLEGLDM